MVRGIIKDMKIKTKLFCFRHELFGKLYTHSKLFIKLSLKYDQPYFM